MKNIQTSKKPPAETFLTSSTACQGIGWNRNKRRTTPLEVYYYGTCESESFISQEISCHSWKFKATYSVPKKPVNIILRRADQSEQKKEFLSSLLSLHKSE
jgi:hypothetical protein